MSKQNLFASNQIDLVDDPTERLEAAIASAKRGLSLLEGALRNKKSKDADMLVRLTDKASGELTKSFHGAWATRAIFARKRARSLATAK